MKHERAYVGIAAVPESCSKAELVELFAELNAKFGFRRRAFVELNSKIWLGTTEAQRLN